jgi:lipopolysaccharide transport system ATP-binding protein
MATAQSLCSKGIVLEKSKIIFSGRTQDAVREYVHISSSALREQKDWSGQQTKNPTCLTGIKLETNNERAAHSIMTGEDLRIAIYYKSYTRNSPLTFNIGIYNSLREKIIHMSTEYSENEIGGFLEKGKLTCTISKVPLVEGKYHINLSLFKGQERLDHVSDACTFDVHPGDFYGSGKIPSAKQSKFLVEHIWTNERDADLQEN